MTSAPMKEWSVSVVQQWFQSMSSEFGPDCTGKVVNACVANNITGVSLKQYKVSKSGEFANMSGILPAFAKMYCNKIRERKLKDIGKKAKSNVPSACKTGPKTEDYFNLNIFFKSKRKKLNTQVTANTTIQTVKELLHTQEIAPIATNDSTIANKLRGMTLLSHGKVLQPTKTLGSYDIFNDNNLITVRYTASGGTYADEEDIYRERTVNSSKYKRVKPSTLKDCITLEGDEGGFDRALMPCGHAIAPDTMFMYIDSIFCKNTKSIRIICPVTTCGSEWDWQLCTEVADMTSKEYAKWTDMRNKRLKDARDEKECPHCQTTCTRKEGVMIFRMRCVMCSNSDWCWECGKPWNHSGLMLCGNNACKVVTTLNNELSNCKTIQQAIAAGVKEHKPLPGSYSFLLPCPVVRACPNCMNIVYHLEACKHMKCIGCSKEFCWFCLAVRDGKKSWPCGGAGDKCKQGRKAVQQFS